MPQSYSSLLKTRPGTDIMPSASWLESVALLPTVCMLLRVQPWIVLPAISVARLSHDESAAAQ